MAVRRLANGTVTVLCGAMVLVAILPLGSIVWMVVSKGWPGLSLEFFTALPTPVGEPGGGVGNAILGTLQMVAMACVLGLPMGIGAGVFLAEKGGGTFGRAVRFTAEVFSGVPSIVIGIVAYGVVVIPMRSFSALAGALALALLMVPVLARTTEELVRLVPQNLREASLALGIPQWKTSLRIMLRTAAGGILTAALLAVARAAGETAPLLFTALNNQGWNFRPDQPTASLTVQIFNYAASPYEDWKQKAWSAALVLLILVGVLNLAARFALRRSAAGGRA
jgi:phosphate transport system permease protein